MNAPGSPQRVIADGLVGAPLSYRRPYDGRPDERLAWAADILRALTDHGYAVVSTAGPGDADWTCGDFGRPGTSDLFLRLQAEVGRLIRDSAADLLAGRSDVVAGLILSHLTRRHGFGPRPRATQPEEQT